MATLSPIDIRTPQQRSGITNEQRNIQAITSILQTLGQGERVRRERQTLDRITRAIGEGATTIEAIAAAAKQDTQFGGGVSGILQRIGGAFQPPGGGGGIEQGIQQSIIGNALRRASTPKAGRVAFPRGWTGAQLETLGLTQEQVSRRNQRRLSKLLGTKAGQELKKDIQTALDNGYSEEEIMATDEVRALLKGR